MLEEGGPGWERGEQGKSLGNGVDVEDEVLAGVGEIEQGDVEDEVVARGLVEDALIDRDGRLLALDDEKGVELRAEDDDVATAGHAVKGDRALDLHELEGIGEGVVEVVDDLLTDRFLGREGHIATTYGVEDLLGRMRHQSSASSTFCISILRLGLTPLLIL